MHGLAAVSEPIATSAAPAAASAPCTRRAVPRDEKALHAKQEREDEDLEPAADDGADAVLRPRRARGGDDERDACEPEEEGRGKAAENRGVPERRRAPHVEPGPGVQRVR